MTLRLFSPLMCSLCLTAGTFAQEVRIPAQEDFHLFLLVGQSNMAGRGTVDDVDREVHPRVLMLDKAAQWVAARDPLHFDKPKLAGVGLGKTFALDYAEQQPEVTVGLIPCAVGGSPISAWEEGGYHDSTRSHPWDDAIVRAREGLKAGTLKGILWHQGESDSTAKRSVVYEEKLHSLVKRFRESLDAPDVPFVVGQLGQFPERQWDDARKRVDAVHRALPGNVSRSAFVKSDGLTHKGDKTHFNSESYREFGHRYFAAYQELVGGEPRPVTNRPNILVIMADDLGFSDLGCYGSEIETPNLDQLAANGLRLTQFHNASRCCPTRAALLTGRVPHEVGLRSNGASLSKDVPTAAEILRDQGYHTAMAGKWHLTHAAALAGDNVNSKKHLAVLNNQTRVELFGDKATYPAARGFQQHYGVVWGIVNYFHPFALVDGFEPVYDLPKDYYLTDALNDKAADYIREFSNDAKPFFVYLAHTAPHWPLHARPEDRVKYSGRYDEGWEVLRQQRYARQVEMGLFDPKIYPLPKIDYGKRKPWNQLSVGQQKRDAAKMETHAAMIHRLDHGLGNVIKALKETKQFDNTLIVFLSDNGASPEEPIRPGYDRPSETPDGRTIRYTGKFPTEELGRDDTWTGLGPALANACNTPFRFWKKESYHGGCASPFIVHWPAGLKAKAGSISEQVAHVCDLLPTFLQTANVDAAKYKPRGSSLMPIIEGRTRETNGKLFFEHSGGAAHRDADWKIVRLKPNQPWALYDLSVDRTETTDLSGKHPERVTAMNKSWNSWWREVTGEEFKAQGKRSGRKASANSK